MGRGRRRNGKIILMQHRRKLAIERIQITLNRIFEGYSVAGSHKWISKCGQLQKKRNIPKIGRAKGKCAIKSYFFKSR